MVINLVSRVLAIRICTRKKTLYPTFNKSGKKLLQVCSQTVIHNNKFCSYSESDTAMQATLSQGHIAILLHPTSQNATIHIFNTVPESTKGNLRG